LGRSVREEPEGEAGRHNRPSVTDRHPGLGKLSRPGSGGMIAERGAENRVGGKTCTRRAASRQYYVRRRTPYAREGRMSTCQTNRVLAHLHRLALRQQRGVTDAQLLERFLARREECAFAELVRRHGPMVLGVGRRILGNAADAEDAFQATFLVLA